jgi:hypothetical protein
MGNFWHIKIVACEINFKSVQEELMAHFAMEKYKLSNVAVGLMKQTAKWKETKTLFCNICKYVLKKYQL